MGTVMNVRSRTALVGVVAAACVGGVNCGVVCGQSGCTSYVAPAVLDPDPSTLFLETAGWYLAADASTVVIGDPNFRSVAGGAVPRIDVYGWHGGVWTREAILGVGNGFATTGIAQVRGSIMVVTDTGAGHAADAVFERTVVGGVAQWTNLGRLPIVTTGARSDANGTFAMDGQTLAVVRSPYSFPVFQFPLLEFYAADPASPIRFTKTVSLPLNDVQIGIPSMLLEGDTLVARAVPQTADPDRLWIYTRLATGWARTQEIYPPQGTSLDIRWGHGLALAGDTLAVGLCMDPQTPTGLSGPSGRVLLFRRTPMGRGADQWMPSGELTAPAGGTNGFGDAIAATTDRIVVGAQLESRTGVKSGAAHLYSRAGAGWAYVGALAVPSGTSQNIGFTVAMSGSSVVAGAPGYQGRGCAYVFDECSQPPMTGDTPRCLPGVFGLMTFLSAWFAGSPFADFNRSGGLEVQDIFDFIGAWFAGCP